MRHTNSCAEVRSLHHHLPVVQGRDLDLHNPSGDAIRFQQRSRAKAGTSCGARPRKISERDI